MSYSFSVRAPTKAKAKEEIEANLKQVVKNQEMHSRDFAAAQAAAFAFVDVLADEPDREIHVSVYGSLSWHGDGDTAKVRAVNVSVSAKLESKNLGA